VAYGRFNRAALAVVFLGVIPLTGCQHLIIDTEKLIKPNVELSGIVGIQAGFGTTFAAFPDLLAMLKRQSSAGMNPRMGAIMGAS
jgi:MtN3 and saliva related transmembrane protein